jgi:hypothetical protein
VEHLVSYIVDGLFQEHSGSRAEPAHGRPLLLAATPGELHYLPLSALGAAMAEHGIAVRQFGAALPAEALVAAVRRTGPAALVLWSSSEATADVSVIDLLPTTRPPVEVFTAGPGWDKARLPSRVVRQLDSLADGLDALLQAATP